MPQPSLHSCSIRWEGDTVDYSTFPRFYDISMETGQKILAGPANASAAEAGRTNPEELFAASVGTCMMLTILAVCSKSRINVVAYEDRCEAQLEFIERRFRITKVTLRPTITIDGDIDRQKLDTLMQKAHANCFINLSVKSEVVIEPIYRKAS